ncbi:hypothetical protein [Staphylococcus borealis]|uniref:hypothetical protein n=1 Tax=Staphylococcus borealis TaxID=2742203 RepID=UPI001F545E38|nr:hypothetical protein [Staphylococcus borealis]
MGFSDKLSFKLADESYKDLKKGREYDLNGQNFKVIEKRDDKQNGLKVYAFAPVVNGKVDTNHIYMGYAETDFKSIRDLLTDLQLPFYNSISNHKINKKYSDLDNNIITEKYNDYSDKSDFFLKVYLIK